MSICTVRCRALVCLLITIFVCGAAHPATLRARAPQADPAALELEKLSRALQEKDTAAKYQQLAVFAKKHSKDAFGARAALALAFRDFTKKKYPDARRWLAQADRDAVLREYALYWSAQLERATGNNAKALALLAQHREDFPESVMTPQVVQAVAELALAANDAPRALAALDGYNKTSSRNDLLLLRGRARELAGQKLAAAADYLSIYYQQPLADEAGAAEKRIDFLLRALGEKFPSIPQAQKLSRAAAIFDAKQWKAAREEFTRLLPELSGPPHERADLRIAQCRVQLKAPIAVLADLKFSDPETDAERLFALSQAYRSLKNEAEMLAAVEALAKTYPQSRWAEEALFAGGNYFWVNLDRARAAEYYRRSMDALPGGKNNLVAHWRIAWASYLERRPQAATQMEDHLRRFPGSPFSANALYWLGRSAERAGNPPQARAFYSKLVERFPQTYFGMQARERLRALGVGPASAVEVINLLPALPALPNLDEPVPDAATERWERGKALRSIAFDASAELEFRAAHALTGAPRLLLEAAKSALDAGRYMPAVATARLAYPQLEARRWEDVPAEVWRLVFPFAYGESILKYAKKNELDPMIVAGLIRQETVFQYDAVSHAGAVGLMQVLPSTGRRLARSQKVGYARARLLNPEYNLRLGTVYFRDLLRLMGSTEAALA
ncbi:MAG: transglycosylase SLT domain-containing protein, partial [Acidobacteria bacterium]|nr:transglycosylase SLT domain-containing protein [Acidobacteriota bacterium]